MRTFLDGSNSPDYFVLNEKYYIEHKIKEDYFEFEFKFYYKNCGRYFVGIGSSNYVRKIHPQDFVMALQNKKIADERTKSYLLSVSEKKECIQKSLF